MTAFHALTPPQRRMIVPGNATAPHPRMIVAAPAAAAPPPRVTMRDRCQHDLILQAVAQEERKEADQYSTKGSLVVARFYATPQVLVLRLADIWTLEPLALNVT